MYLDLNPELTPTQTALKEETHRFAAEIARPATIELDKLADPQDVIKQGSVFWDVFRKHYELERHLAGMPEEFGGANLTRPGHATSWPRRWAGAPPTSPSGWAPAAMPFSMGLLAAQMTGNQRLMDEIVMPYIKDREAKYIGCWAITEPQHGSDTAAAEPAGVPEQPRHLARHARPGATATTG